MIGRLTCFWGAAPTGDEFLWNGEKFRPFVRSIYTRFISCLREGKHSSPAYDFLPANATCFFLQPSLSRTAVCKYEAEGQSFTC